MPKQQCPVCGQKMEKAAPFCPQCGAAMALVMKPVRLLTDAKWLDTLAGMIAGCGLLAAIGFLAGQIVQSSAYNWITIYLVIALLGSVGAYFLIRRFYPFVARGVAITYIVALLIFLGILWICSHSKPPPHD